jgi:hypothetical protein
MVVALIVVAVIVVAVNPFVNVVGPVMVPPVKLLDPKTLNSCCSSALYEEPDGLPCDVSPVVTICINVVGVIAVELANVLSVST